MALSRMGWAQVTPAIAPLCLASSTIASGHDVTFTTATTVNNYYEAPFVSPGLQWKIADWLFQPPSYHVIQKETYEKSARGTGEWFLRSPIFEDWVSKESGTLWGIGIPGAGKTCLTAIIVNHLTELVLRNSRNRASAWKPEAVTCVYCRSNDKLSSTQIFSSILMQLVEVSTEVAQHVEASLYIPCTQNRTRPTQTEILAELKCVLPFFSRIFVVVDALDELDDDICHEVIQELLSIDRHLLMTSREIHLRSSPKQKFTIRAPSADIQIFVERELDRFPKVSSLLEGKADIRRDMINAIGKRSDGMFLLAALQLAALRGITTIKSLRTAVANLPSTLNDMYQATLDRINSQSTEETSLAHRAILWATHAIRPLRVDEFLVAVSIDPDLESDAVDPEAIPKESTVLAVCCGLVTFGKEDRTVRLVHYTAHNFFTNCQTGILRTPHAYAVSVCTTYLQHKEAHGIPDDLIPFDSYSYRGPGSHISWLAPLTIEDIPTCARRFFQAAHQMGKGLPLYLPELKYLGDDVGNVSHLGALYGILPLIDILPEGLFSPSIKGYTPLDIACIAGHSFIVTHILKHHQLHSGSWLWTKHTIYLASRKGYDTVVKFLLGQTGVDANEVSREYSGETALDVASEMGHVRVVELLLQFPGIDVNHDTDTLKQDPPLYKAVRNGHNQIVELLIEFPSIHVNAEGALGETSLHLACKKGNLCAVRMLLDSPGININAKSRWSHRTPLEVSDAELASLWLGTTARRGEYKEIIKLLLERGAIRSK